MYTDLIIQCLEDGGYSVQKFHHERGLFNAYIAAFSTKSELLAWLATHLVSRSPDFAGEQPAAPAKDTDDEIPF